MIHSDLGSDCPWVVMVDWEAMVGPVLMVFPECMDCFNLLISCFNLSLRILSSCSILNDWSCVKALVKLLVLLGATAAGIDPEEDGGLVCWLITLIACVKASNWSWIPSR